MQSLIVDRTHPLMASTEKTYGRKYDKSQDINKKFRLKFKLPAKNVSQSVSFVLLLPSCLVQLVESFRMELIGRTLNWTSIRTFEAVGPLLKILRRVS